MGYRLLADLVAAVHLAFVVGVVLGGLLVLRRPRLAWLHVPVAVWGAAIELGGWVCPLTPLENRLRRLGGEAGYESDFVERYVLALLYPSGLTRTHQVVLGLAVLALNAAVYAWAWRRRRARAPGAP
jgi:hypothetical protein